MLKSYNFLFFGLLALFIPFLPVFMKAQGLTESEVGLIIGIGGFVTIIAQPFWGMVSDRLKTVRKIILILVFFTTISGFALYEMSTFSTIVLLTLIVYAFLMPLDPLTESFSFTTAETLKITYGSVRTYGALGYAVMALVVGYSIDWFGMSSISYFFAVLGIVCFFIVLKLDEVPTSPVPISISGLKKMLLNKELLLFLILVFIASIPARMNDTFLGIHIVTLHGDTKLVGIAFFISAATEIIIFALSFLWLKKGYELHLITIAIFFYAIRFLLSAIVDNSIALIAIQTLQMVTFPIFYTAAIQYLYQIVPAEWRATGQTVLALLFFGISGIISSSIGGYIYTIFGGHIFYYVLATISSIAFLYGLFLVIRHKKRA